MEYNEQRVFLYTKSYSETFTAVYTQLSVLFVCGWKSRSINI